MSPIGVRIGVTLSIGMLLLTAACSDVRKGNTPFNSETGKHPTNWIVDHRAAFISDTGQCTPCHGSDLMQAGSAGGISKVSCYSATFNGMSCHVNGPGHPAGWSNPGSHGSTAKTAPDNNLGHGFQYCERCHGVDFAGGSVNRSCFTCHTVTAPHSPKPWRTSAGSARTHTDTDSGNAPVCAQCHLNGLNSTVQPNPPAPAGTAPGCFNSTLCHGVVGHAVGWASPDVHGASAKSAPGTSSGFAYCQSCHGTAFNSVGGTATTSCLNTAGCHGATVASPHSPAPWRSSGTTTRTHTTTNTANASVCNQCHALGANSTRQPVPPYGTTAGCFNNSLCHGIEVAPHAVPFTASTDHGPAAKADLTYCEGCHANPSNGGAGTNPQFNVSIGSLVSGCEDCHVTNTAHPKPWSANNAFATSHQSAGNMANACALCHGATLTGGTGPACGTCHTAGSPLTLMNCTSCHASPPSGTSAPNRAGSHAKHYAITVACGSCHSNAGSGTALHKNAAVDVAISPTYNGVVPASFNASAHTCSNVSCHADAYSTGSATTPPWGTASACGTCHGNSASGAPSTGSHTSHTGIASCGNCHAGAVSGVSGGTAHLDGNIDVIDGYPANVAKHAAGTYTGACANIYCHSNGTSILTGTIPANASPTWGGNINCGSCHGTAGDDGRPNYPNNSPKRNTHGDGVSYGITHKATACPTCHTGISGSAGAYTVNPATHNNGVYDLQASLGYTQATGVCSTPGCHGSAVWGGTLSCIGCHNVIQNAPNASLASGGTVTHRDAVVGEFGLAWGHKKTGRGAVTDADCIVCHLEGNFSTQKQSGVHGDGYINLRDPDGVGETSITNISGATYSFVSFSTSYAAGARTSTGHTANTVDNILTQKFCLACHDSNGATNTTARSGAGTQYMPFGGVNLGANYTVANGAAAVGGLVDVKTQLATANRSWHPVLGPKNRDYPTAARMADPYKPTGTRGTSGTLSQGVVLNCFDCHNVTSTTPAGGLTKRTVAAHGNAVTIRGVAAVSGTPASGTNEATFCKVCHLTYTAAQNHGAGSGFTSSTDSGMNNYVGYGCNACHSSGYSTAVPRPVRAQDTHGSNTLGTVGTLATAVGRWSTDPTPVAFIRNRQNLGRHAPLSLSVQGSNPAWSSGTQCMGNGANPCNQGNQTYSPGGTY
jgi:predicted CxxxxCH...CXXCH cytochrome family protein